MRIDAHQHYWDPARGDYQWLTPALTTLYRPFGSADLAPLRAAARIERTVLVQAAPTLDETCYLLDLARTDDSVAGVIGWVPMLLGLAPTLIDALAREPKFKGVRPMLQDLPDDHWIANPDIAPAVDALIARDLAFDALIDTRHVEALETFAKRFPNVRIVVDHAAKPPIREGHAGWAPWAEAITRLARLPNVHCKLSGLATQAPADWTVAMLQPYVDHLIDTFGAARLMWGSNWPLLNLNGDYARWHAAALTLVATLDEAEREAVFGGNAAAFYHL